MSQPVFWDLLLFKTAANLRTEVSRYYLNYLWWIVEPVLFMLIFYVVFGIILDRGTADFAGFLLCGLMGWNWFARTIGNSSDSILGARGLMQLVPISKVFFPLEVVLRDAVKQCFVVVLLLTFLGLRGATVPVTWVALPVVLLVQGLLMTGVAVLIAGLVPFVPDLKVVTSTGLTLLFFGSGVFYDIDAVVLPEHRQLMYLNPMAGLLVSYRALLLDGAWPDWSYLGLVAVAGLMLIGVAVSLVRRWDHVYPRIC